MNEHKAEMPQIIEDDSGFKLGFKNKEPSIRYDKDNKTLKISKNIEGLNVIMDFESFFFRLAILSERKYKIATRVYINDGLINDRDGMIYVKCNKCYYTCYCTRPMLCN